MTRKPSLTRRDFLRTAAAAAIAVPAIVPRSVLGGDQPAAGEQITVGMIGLGMQADGYHIPSLLGLADVRVLAVCDVDTNRRRHAKQRIDEHYGATAKGCDEYNDFRDVLARKDIDAVLIATPDHWHAIASIEACKAGKDVYCEKPMCWSIEQGVDMIKAVRKTDRIVQIGMQRRSAPAIRELKQVFDDGVLGNVYLVQAEWFWKYPGSVIQNDPLEGTLDWERFCGPAGKQAFEPMKYRYWRFFWPFSGGNETDQGTHLMDVVQWMMGCDQPISALQYGTVYVNKPTETPDVFSCVFEYPKFTATWTLNYTTPKWRNGWSIVFHGEKAALFLTEQGYRIFDQVNGWENGLPKPKKENMPGGLTVTEPHIQNFLECIKTRKEPNAPVEVGFKAVRTLHLANAALKRGSKAVLAEDGMTIKA
jgi:predicted dehydrogenase